MSKIKQLIRSILTPRLIWDFFMLQAVILNLHLIVFDLTYLTLRPYYLSHLPVVTEFYDPFLGIEPHRTTQDYLSLVDEYNRIMETPDSEEKKIAIQFFSQKLTEQSMKIIEENPFEKAGLTANLQKMKYEIKLKYENATGIAPEKSSSKDALKWFWTYDPTTIKEHLAFFKEDIYPLIQPNYYRHYGLNGKYKDEFLKLDLPFFLLFLIEFLVQWWLAIKNRVYVAWFLYPMYHWYDVLGLIPMAEFRFFRLFRVISMYILLKNSNLTNVGNDIFTRTFTYYTNIIKEEITDMVTVRILSEMQEEIRSGASINLITSAVESRREQLKKLIIENIKKGLANPKANETIRKLLAEALVRSSNNASTLQLVPSVIKETVTKDIGLAIFDSMNEVVISKLTGENGEENINLLIDNVLDDVILGSQDSEFNKLSEDMSVEILENMKKAVSIKKWVKAKI
ncbi:MAG: hypothetical protein IPL26_26895 [Leptospiraceae bacterium]|nr:hypothetical protein [Leptospiraceae bacterium]